MNTNSQSFPLNKIPFYRTRKFWAVVMLVMFIWSMLLYFTNFYGASHSLSRIVSDLSMAFGATPFVLVGIKIVGKIGGWIGIVAYFIILTFIVKGILKREEVNLIYPFGLLFLFLIGIYANITFLSSFI